MYKIYTVTNNDTIESISKYLNISEDELRKINGFSPYYEVTVGEQIIVPITKFSYFDNYVIEKGDTIYSVAQKYNVDPNQLLSLNGMEKDNYIYAGQEILVPRDDIDFYVTKQGDTITTIINIFKSSLEDIYRYNPSIYLVEDQLIVEEKEKN